ncbi:hypothetical protein AAZX31_05G081000 [Glycine max]
MKLKGKSWGLGLPFCFTMKCCIHFSALSLLSLEYLNLFLIINILYCKFYANFVFILLISYPDVALVTSLRDGMNLVSYEFMAYQDKKKGVLILSEVIMETC